MVSSHERLGLCSRDLLLACLQDVQGSKEATGSLYKEISVAVIDLCDVAGRRRQLVGFTVRRLVAFTSNFIPRKDRSLEVNLSLPAIRLPVYALVKLHQVSHVPLLGSQASHEFGGSGSTVHMILLPRPVTQRSDKKLVRIRNETEDGDHR